MAIDVRPYRDDDADQYSSFVESVEHSLLYGSLRFRALLETILGDVEPLYLIAREDSRIVGILPAFLHRNDRHGPVLNSLPYYGSNGGPLVADRHPDRRAVERALVDEFDTTARDRGAVASTIVTSPFAQDLSAYHDSGMPYLRDERIGQLTPLPSSAAEPAEALMALYHQKTRNSVRKGQKSGFSIYRSGDESAFRSLYELHRIGMNAIGVPAKDWSFFSAVRKIFRHGEDYCLYLAEKDGQVASAMLVFFFNRFAEYYVPATLEEFRPLQPLSALVLEAMTEACRRGCTYWNWGGTQRSNKGVYDFKKRWGAIDLPYYYFTREYGERKNLRNLPREEILAEYPFFYVLPFSVLSTDVHPSETGVP